MIHIVILVALCWLIALWGVVHDLLARSAPAREILVWVPLTLVLGPLAAPFYLLEVLINHRQPAIGRAPAQPSGSIPQPAPQLVSPVIVAGPQPARRRQHNTCPALATTLMPGSGTFLYIRTGLNAHQSIEIPANGSIIVRRGAPDERSTPGTLVLHDPAVSRKQHCRVTLYGGQCIVEDMSTHGSLVDGRRIHHTTATLKIGSLIRAGSTTLVLLSQSQLKTTNKA